MPPQNQYHVPLSEGENSAGTLIRLQYDRLRRLEEELAAAKSQIVRLESELATARAVPDESRMARVRQAVQGA